MVNKKDFAVCFSKEAIDSKPELTVVSSASPRWYRVLVLGPMYGDSYDLRAYGMPHASGLQRCRIWPGEKDYAANLGGRDFR